jgi:hypothetical protein
MPSRSMRSLASVKVDFGGIVRFPAAACHAGSNWKRSARFATLLQPLAHDRTRLRWVERGGPRAGPMTALGREGLRPPVAAQGQLATQLARRRCLNRAGLKSNGSRRAKVGIDNSDGPSGALGQKPRFSKNRFSGRGRPRFSRRVRPSYSRRKRSRRCGSGTTRSTKSSRPPGTHGKMMLKPSQAAL